MALGLKNNILNQKGTPAFFSDIFANRPAFGYAGRVFISTDTGAIYEDTGTAWTLIADATGTPTVGTLQTVTTNGNTTNAGISITAGGLATNAAQITGLTQDGGVLFTDGFGNLGQDVNFNWDVTNNYLGIGQTGTPTAPLDIHNGTVGVQIQLNATSTNNSTISFQNASVGKWRVGNLYSAGSNLFHIYNNTTASNALTISSANAVTLIGSLTGTNAIFTAGSGPIIKLNGGTNSQLAAYDTTGTTAKFTMQFTTNGTNFLGQSGFLNFQSSFGSTQFRLEIDGTNTFGYDLNIKNTIGGSVTINLAASTGYITANKFIQTGGTSSQILAADGSVITAGTNITISGGTISASGGGITGTGVFGQLAVWSGTSSETGFSTLTFTNSGALGLTISPSLTAAAALAQGGLISPTLTAAANNDELIGLDINPTFTNGAFTTVRNIGLRVQGIYISKGAGSTTTSIAIGNNQTLYKQTTANNNIAIGINALIATLTGGSNVAIGTNALTTAISSSNVAIGVSAASALSSNGNVVAIGASALQNNTGTDNVAIGLNVLSASSSGGTNVAIGSGALQSNTGAKNIAIGYQAGRYAGSGTSTSNSTSANGVYIGYDVRSSANANTNEIVISGYNGTAGQIGLGSNTTIIGNSSTTLTSIPSGSLVVNSNSDNGQGKLQVNGTVTMSAISASGTTYAASATVSALYYHVINGGSAVNLTLLSPASNNLQYMFINATANAVTITAATATNIINLLNASVSSITLAANARTFIIADGNNKYYQIF